MNSEPKKYQAYLQEGFELVKINYSLLSYISALGAYRKNMQKIQQSAVFLGSFILSPKNYFMSLSILKL